MGLRSLWGWHIPQWELQACSGPSLGVSRGRRKPKALLPTDSICPGLPVLSPPQSVGMWAPGTYPVIRATQQAGRGLREGPAEAAASAGSCLPSSRGQGREAGLWGPLSGEHRLSSSRQRALGRSSGPAPPTQARPGPHFLAWASSHHGAARCSGPLATAAAVLQGALLGHLGSPCRVSQGLGPPRWNRPGSGAGQGNPRMQPWRVTEISMSDFGWTRGREAGTSQWCDLGPPLSGHSYLQDGDRRGLSPGHIL